MLDLTRGPARERLERLDRRQAEQLQRSGALITDDRRQRPLYFDGRFLTARDLTREQNYFLTRQADLGRAGGAGIVAGLQVQLRSASALQITPGHGITPAGELVLLRQSLDLQLAELTTSQRLDAAFGLSAIPREPARNLTGLFVLALRPVEFTANPIASYPTTVDGPRTVEFGDIVEGVAATLIPYPQEGTAIEPGLRRAQIARDLFVSGAGRGLPVEALPLTLVALDRGVIQWSDPFLVRREVGAEHGDILGLGFAPRARREAHFLQYEQHLQEVLAQRDAAGRRRQFAASEHFLALPPAGRLPAAAINPADFSQIYFPPEFDVELSIVPEDEIPALVEESLLLPPFDLSREADELESVAVLILIPVPRLSVRRLRSQLTSLSRQLRSAAPGLVARRKPLESLRGLRLPRVPTPIVRPEDLIDAAWREALAGTDLLWYLRRRNLSVTTEITGASVVVVGDEVAEERDMLNRLREVDLNRRWGRLKNRASTLAEGEIVGLLSSSKLAPSRLLLSGAVSELEATERLDRTSTLRVAERYADPAFGEGIVRLETLRPEFQANETIIQTISEAGVVPELDRISRRLGDAELAQLAGEIATVAESGDREQVASLIQTRAAEIGR